jgi:hypothetical protein
MFIELKNLSKKENKVTTKTLYVGLCDKCQTQFERQYILHLNLQEKFEEYKLCDMCKKCFKKFRFSGCRNPAFGKVYRTKETHPEWADSISKTSKGTINLGDKNGMKNPEAQLKASKTRREKVTSDPEYRKARAKFQREAWASGKYDGVKTGLCKWYDHIKHDGTLIKLQGTWEVAYARYLDEQNINYVAHKGYWKYVGEDNKEHTYHPDFYLVDEDLTIDIKGAFWDSQQENKINYIVSSNPDKKLKILRREDLDELGINLQKIQIELLNKEQK